MLIIQLIMFKRLLQTLQKTYTTQVYSKLRITRMPHERSAFFLDNNITVAEFIQQIRGTFIIPPNVQLIAGSHFQINPFQSIITQDIIKSTEQIKAEPLLSLLLSGDFYLYEIINQQPALCYGIEISEYNLSNNRNLSERIGKNIITLAETWENFKTMEETIKKGEIISEQQKALTAEDQQQSSIAYRKCYSTALQIANLINTQAFNQLNRPFIIRMAALMSVNWLFLFGVTYFKYGWDVGEPLSYITSLTVDLAAMSGIFSLNQRLQTQGKIQYLTYTGMLNAKAQLNLMKWLINFHRKNLI